MTRGAYDPWQWFSQAVREHFAFLLNDAYGFEFSGATTNGRWIEARYDGPSRSVEVGYEPFEGWLGTTVVFDAGSSGEMRFDTDEVLQRLAREEARVSGADVVRVDTKSALDDLVNREARAVRDYCEPLLRGSRTEAMEFMNEMLRRPPSIASEDGLD